MGTFIFVLFLIAFKTPGHVVINELFYDPIGLDTGCFVELMGKPGLSLDGYYLSGINGGSGQQYCMIDLAGYKISQDGFFVIAQDASVPNADIVNPVADFQNGPDNLEVWLENEKIDSVGYGDFSQAIFTGEGSPTLDLVGYSVGRRPDGMDTNDNSIDFVGLTIPSPGLPNVPIAVFPAKWLLTNWGKIKEFSGFTRSRE